MDSAKVEFGAGAIPGFVTGVARAFDFWGGPHLSYESNDEKGGPGSTRISIKHQPLFEINSLHHMTTDMCFWRGQFYLVHASSPWHISSKHSRIVLWRSEDFENWERIREFQMPGLDIRDPKLAVIHDRLFLYVLSNRGIVAEPSQSYVSSSENGEDWSQKQELEPKGWILWRPKTFDHKNWYVGAYWHEHGISILLKSQDGRRWEKVSEIHRGGFNDETDIEFLPDGRILSTIRIEGSGAPLGGVLGHSEGGTLLAVSEPPYQNWTHGLSKTTRLDGPNLFRLGETLYALGRYHCNAGAGWTNRMGSFLGRKRTSLYKVGLGELVHIADFPSCGDTGYPGVVVKEGAIYVCYYTNGLGRDYRWLHGLFLPSHVRLAKIPVSSIP